MDRSAITKNQDKPEYPSIPIIGPSKEEVANIKSTWDFLLSSLRGYRNRGDSNNSNYFEAEFVPYSSRLAFMRFYRNGKKIFHGNLQKEPDRIKLSLFEDYDNHSMLDYKSALLAISGFIKELGVGELEVLIQDSFCSAPTARSFKKTMELIGLEKECDKCGDFLHETWFSGKISLKNLTYAPNKLQSRISEYIGHN